MVFFTERYSEKKPAMPDGLKFIWISCILLLSSAGSFAQKSKVIQLDEPIIIDGQIEAIWKKADSISTFYQLEPNPGQSASRKTVVRSAQYQDKLYFLFKCYISNPNEIRASIQHRDQLSMSDDLISLVLDTYNDHHNAFLFQVNPIGTISDAKIADDGKTIDYLWDTNWEAQVAISSDFWTVEIAIPMKSLRFDSQNNGWGCNFSRSIRVNQEISWWSQISENFRISQNGQLTGINPIDTDKHHLTAFPYGTLRYENSDISKSYHSLKGDAGLDLEYQYSSNFKANLTVNPDFATVEGDKEQINLTPWELKFPEKRLFFQDGNEMFGTRIQTFYSRRIGDMRFGGKATGKVGKYQFNGLYANTKSDLNADSPGAHFNALKIKRDILKSSTIGLTYTDKLTDTSSVHTFSADYVLNLGKTWKLTGQFVSSAPDISLDRSAWYVRFARENNIYHYHVRYTELGNKFRENVNQTGFISDDNRKEVDSDILYKFWPDKLVEYISLSGKNNAFWSQSGVLRSWYLSYGSRFYFKNRLSLDLYYNNEYKNRFRNVQNDYFNHFYRAILGYNTDENSHIQLSYRTGQNFHRNFTFLELNTRFQLLKKISINYELKNIIFNPDPKNESTWLNVLGLSYYHTKDLWLKVFSQHSTQNKRLYFYGLMGWRFKPPFGALYLIYNTDQFNQNTNEPRIYSDIVFLKLTYPITIL